MQMNLTEILAWFDKQKKIAGKGEIWEFDGRMRECFVCLLGPTICTIATQVKKKMMEGSEMSNIPFEEIL